ncbi:MAG: HNH endonuclease [Desulfobacteraceae bacterium]|nr:HNH endonuclease [Desulfobacteraceae bacterium]
MMGKCEKQRSGKTGRFQAGHVPWNDGTKGQGLTGANRKSFKKGNVPANRKPLWTERVCPKDGFILMKVPERNPYTGFSTRYKHKHVYIWEQEHGPVPKGMVVAFIDGDKTNCEPENLMLISRAELLALNQHGYKNMPDELKPNVLALSKLQAKTWAIEADQRKQG